MLLCLSHPPHHPQAFAQGQNQNFTILHTILMLQPFFEGELVIKFAAS